jgi:hypothetical protein
MAASLVLSGGRWVLAIVDGTSGAAAHFFTRQETGGRFNLAEWTQEDVTNEHTGKPFAYPRLSAVRFWRLAVNSVSPHYADLYSTWMAEHGHYLAPSPLHDDSFTLGPAIVNTADARYLRLAAAEDAAITAFILEFRSWTPTTSRSEIALDSTMLVTMLRDNIRGLEAAHWPAPARRPVRSLIRGLQVDIDNARSAPRVRSSQLSRWISTWVVDAAPVGWAGHTIRRDLHIPEITPTG